MSNAIEKDAPTTIPDPTEEPPQTDSDSKDIVEDQQKPCCSNTLPRMSATDAMKDLVAYCEANKNTDFLLEGKQTGMTNPLEEENKCNLF